MKKQRGSDELFTQKQRNGRGNHPHSLANLKPFARGKSGNPSGLPQGVPKVSIALMSLLRGDANTDYQPKTRAEQLAWALFQRALNGEVPALREVMDRSEGRTPQTVNVNDSIEGTAAENIKKAARALAELTKGTRDPLTIAQAEARIKEIQVSSAQLSAIPRSCS
jgi:hypothetical protein